ncbi:MAG: PQQ-binding-like beta-propeller repeat protein, partial [Planctomycetota bacterium]
AMAQAPDPSAMPWRGRTTTAAEVKAFLRRGTGADHNALPALPPSPVGRLALPAAMAARAPWLGGRWESWCLGPWAVRRIECLDRQVLFFGPRHVACYDRATLALRWQHAGADSPAAEERAEALTSPAWRPVAMGSTRSSAAGGRAVYALLSRGEGGADLVALDAASGRAIWTTQGRPEWDAVRILSEPAADEDVVYVLAMEQDLQRTCTPYLVCLAGDDARILWKRRLGTLMLSEQSMDLVRYACGVAVHQGAVYVSTNMGILARCDARTGTLDWVRTYRPAISGDGAGRRARRRGRQEQEGNLSAPAMGRARREGSVPLPIGGQVFFAPRDHSGVMALDRQTGQLAWESLLVPSDQIVGLAGRALVVRDAEELAALDAATGEELWHRPVDSLGAAPAVMAGGHVLITVGDTLLRLWAQTGQLVDGATVPRALGAEHVLLPGGALVALAEEPLLERTLAPETGGNPGPLRPPFVKRWTLPCRDPLLVIPPASQPASDLAGVLSGARFYCLRLRPACRLAWQMAFREPPDSAGFHGSLVVFATGADLTAVDKETGAVRWRRTLPFDADLVAGDDRMIVAARSSGQAPVMAISPQIGATLWCRWFGQEPRFSDRRLRWVALTGEPGAPPTLRLYWGAAMFAREGPRPAEVLVEAASGAIRDVRLFLPREPIWPARLSFGDDTRTRPAEDATIPWPYRGPFRSDAVAYLGRDLVGRFALRDDGSDLAAGWNPQADSSAEAARRWAGLFATPAGCYVKRLGQLAFFDAQAKQEILFHLPRTGDRKNAFAIGDFREEPGEQLTVVSVAPGRPYETAAGEANKSGEGDRTGDEFNIVGLRVSDYTKGGLHDDAGNGDVTLTYYGRGVGSQVRIQARGLPEAGANLVATLLNGFTREHYYPQPVKMTGLASLGWAKYDVFL